MDTCCAAFRCGYLKGIRKSDLNRYTDKIDNVLNDEEGRGYFKKFMVICKFNDGLRVLDFWENIERLLTHSEELEGASFADLIKKAKGIQEFDSATMMSMTTAQNLDKEEMERCLKSLKEEAKKALIPQYNAFREELIASSSN